MGRFREHVPAEGIAAVAESVWTHTPDTVAQSSSPPSELRVTADGCIDLIAELKVAGGGEVALTSLAVCGPTARPCMVAVTSDSAWVGVRFRYGMAGPVLGVHPPDLFNQQVEAATCCRPLAHLTDRLAGCMKVSQVIGTLTAYLAEAAGRYKLDDVAIRTQRAMGLLVVEAGVAGVARRIGVSERTLHRDILAAAGMPPKTLARLLRFRRTLARLRRPDSPDLCALALESGYADQSHMTREFQALAGVTPSTLMKSGSVNSPHV